MKFVKNLIVLGVGLPVIAALIVIIISVVVVVCVIGKVAQVLSVFFDYLEDLCIWILTTIQDHVNAMAAKYPSKKS